MNIIRKKEVDLEVIFCFHFFKNSDTTVMVNITTSKGYRIS